MIKQSKLTVHIPTVQYGFVEQEVTFEGDDQRDLEDAIQSLKKTSDMVAQKGSEFEVRGLPVSSGRTTLQVEDDGIDFKSILLGQTTKVKEVNGHKRIPGYMGGSSFPKTFYAPFDTEGILNAIAKKFGVSTAEVQAMWKLNSEASTGYGTAIHAALENYDKNRQLGHKIRSSTETKKNGLVYSPNKALSKNPFIKAIVEWFAETVKESDDVQILTEEFIWNHEKSLCGSIDRTKIIDWDKKILRIQDYKTDGDIHQKEYQLKTSPFYALTQGDAPKLGKELLDHHWLQLSFYAYILTLAGWTVEGLDVFWLNPNKLLTGKNPWEVFSHDVIDISGVL